MGGREQLGETEVRAALSLFDGGRLSWPWSTVGEVTFSSAAATEETLEEAPGLSPGMGERLQLSGAAFPTMLHPARLTAQRSALVPASLLLIWVTWG